MVVGHFALPGRIVGPPWLVRKTCSVGERWWKPPLLVMLNFSTTYILTRGSTDHSYRSPNCSACGGNVNLRPSYRMDEERKNLLHRRRALPSPLISNSRPAPRHTFRSALKMAGPDCAPPKSPRKSGDRGRRLVVSYDLIEFVN
jgi:hypothetical protein